MTRCLWMVPNLLCLIRMTCKTSRWILAMMLQVLTLSMNTFPTDLEGFVEVTGKNGARRAGNGLILGITKAATIEDKRRCLAAVHDNKVEEERRTAAVAL